ncbi:uncharacterized protein LOC123011568 [Tribolium madens]|uniref:uncharacterized protein LOC123011568 n=1 Tax=Tribolium madens TaxID=41895 RepID=UPI001CF726D8|nr:uncharacterized protein LOC123011568 [Tribolium madens]
MSRPLIFLALTLTVFFSVASSSSDSPCRREKFKSYEDLNVYLACVKMQATMRYGKRAPPSLLLRKLQPDVFTDYENDFPAISNMLYGDN